MDPAEKAVEKIKEEFEGRSKEECCKIMAMVCIQMGYYDQAEEFVRRCVYWRDEERKHVSTRDR